MLPSIALLFQVPSSPSTWHGCASPSSPVPGQALEFVSGRAAHFTEEDNDLPSLCEWRKGHLCMWSVSYMLKGAQTPWFQHPHGQLEASMRLTPASVRMAQAEEYGHFTDGVKHR